MEGGREGVKVGTEWATMASIHVSPEETALAKAWRMTGHARFESVTSPSSLLCLVQGVAEKKEKGDETGKISQGQNMKGLESESELGPISRFLVTRCRG